jgi:hypothetical protein
MRSDGPTLEDQINAAIAATAPGRSRPSQFSTVSAGAPPRPERSGAHRVDVAERDRAIAAAIGEGRISTSRRSHYETMWANDPTGTRRLLTASEREGGLAALGRPIAGGRAAAPARESHEAFMAREFPGIATTAAPVPAPAAPARVVAAGTGPAAGDGFAGALRGLATPELRSLAVSATDTEKEAVGQELQHREMMRNHYPAAAAAAGYTPGGVRIRRSV